MFYDYWHQDLSAAERDNYQERLYQAEYGEWKEPEEIKDIEEEYLSRITGREIEIEESAHYYQLRTGLKKATLKFDPFKRGFFPLRDTDWDFPGICKAIDGLERLQAWQRENLTSYQGF